MQQVSEFLQHPVYLPSNGDGELELLYSSDAGFSQIWKGRRNDKFRIWKALKPEYRGGAVMENLLHREFEIGYSLSHPNIREYYSFSYRPDIGNCIEMEWIEGDSLTKRIDAGLTSNETKKILFEIIDALSYIHHKQIVHKDLKPENILITTNGVNVKIIDFGFSDTDFYAMNKSNAGTLKFASPEMLGNKETDARTDIYSFGMIMREMTKKYSGVANKCCRQDKTKRYENSESIKKAILSRIRLKTMVYSILILTVIVSGMIIARDFSGRKAADFNKIFNEATRIIESANS